MRKRKDINEQGTANSFKKSEIEETNATNRKTYYQIYSFPSQIGFLPENIAMSQKNKWTINDYFNATKVNEQSSSSHDNPEYHIPRGDNPDSARYPANSDNPGQPLYPVPP
eukprot:5367972-Heterocapsa_arctica.AAC.1